MGDVRYIQQWLFPFRQIVMPWSPWLVGRTRKGKGKEEEDIEIRKKKRRRGGGIVKRVLCGYAALVSCLGFVFRSSCLVDCEWGGRYRGLCGRNQKTRIGLWRGIR